VTLAGRLTVRRDDGGQALVEIALAIPLVFLVLLGGADFARGLNIDLALGSAARSAAELAALADDPALFDATAAVRGDLAHTPGLDPSAASAAMTTHNGDGVDGSCVDDPPSVENPCFSTVRVTYTFSTLFGWPGLPRSIVFERSRTFRRI